MGPPTIVINGVLIPINGLIDKWVFPKIGVPRNGVVYNGNPLLKLMIWGYHHLRNPPSNWSYNL